MAEQDAVGLTVLHTSIRGTSPVFVVMLAGFMASKMPRKEHLVSSMMISSVPLLFVLLALFAALLSRESCRAASRLCTLLFQPALMVSSIGSTLTLSSLQESWQLIVAATFTIVMSFATAWLFGRVFLRPQDRRDFMPVQLAIAFPNAGAFPLLLMDSLCEQDIINSDFEHDAQECTKSATAMIFIYLVVWQLVFFSWGFEALGYYRSLEWKLSGQSADSGGTMRDIEDSLRTKIGNELTNDTEHGTESSDDIPFDTEQYGAPTEIPTAQKTYGSYEEERGGEEWKDETSGHQAASTTAPKASREKSPLLNKQGVSSTTLSTEIIGAKMNNSESPMSTTTSTESSWGKYAMEILISPNIIAVFVGITISSVPFLQEIFFTNPRGFLWPIGAAVQTLGGPAVAVSLVVMAGSLVQVPTAAGAMNGQGKWSRGQIIMGVLHVVCRLIAFPAGGFALYWLASANSSVLGSNRLMHLILLIEFAVPSASLIIASLNQLRMPATAGFMARLYIVQYFISMFTVSAWTALALQMVY